MYADKIEAKPRKQKLKMHLTLSRGERKLPLRLLDWVSGDAGVVDGTGGEKGLDGAGRVRAVLKRNEKKYWKNSQNILLLPFFTSSTTLAL